MATKLSNSWEPPPSHVRIREKQVGLKKMKYLLVLFIVLASLGMINLWEEERSVHYKTYQEAITSNYSKRGWIPEFVPKDAYEITDWHILSPQKQILSFKFKDSTNFKRLLSEHNWSSQELKRISKTQIETLPRGMSPDEQINFYESSAYGRDSHLIVQWSSKKVCFCLK